MSTTPDAIQQFATQEGTNLTAIGTALTGVVSGIAALDADITALQQQIASGSSILNAQDQAALNALTVQSGQLLTSAQGISTAIPAAAAPAPSAAPPTS